MIFSFCLIRFPEVWLDFPIIGIDLSLQVMFKIGVESFGDTRNINRCGDSVEMWKSKAARADGFVGRGRSFAGKDDLRYLRWGFASHPCRWREWGSDRGCSWDRRAGWDRWNLRGWQKIGSGLRKGRWTAWGWQRADSLDFIWRESCSFQEPMFCTFAGTCRMFTRFTRFTRQTSRSFGWNSWWGRCDSDLSRKGIPCYSRQRSCCCRRWAWVYRHLQTSISRHLQNYFFLVNSDLATNTNQMVRATCQGVQQLWELWEQLKRICQIELNSGDVFSMGAGSYLVQPLFASHH